MIIYVFKLVTGLIPKPGLEWTCNYRIRTNVEPSYCHSVPTQVETVWGRSFNSRGSSFYNTIPQITTKGARRHKPPTEKICMEQFKVRSVSFRPPLEQ